MKGTKRFYYFFNYYKKENVSTILLHFALERNPVATIHGIRMDQNEQWR